MDGDRLTRAGGAGQKKVGHSSQICEVRVAGNVSPKRNQEWQGTSGILFVGNERTEAYDRFERIGNFNSHQRFAGYRRFDPHGMRGECQFKIILKREDS